MTKMTKKVALECALCAVKNWELKEYRMADENTTFTADEVVAKLNEMWDALNKKSSGEKPLTEQQKQNLGYKGDILVALADGKARTATELMNEVPTFPEGMSNQRVSALLRQMIQDGKVKKEIVKGKAMFSIVEGV
jgi:predicted HTH transcriptional regulator